MAAIFLSYSREDHPFAEGLVRFVEQAGHDVWWDRDIDSGSEFSGEIEAALERAEAVLVAWSRTSAKSAWVRDEAAIGRDSGRLVSVVIDGSQPPIGFRQFQTLDLTGWQCGKKDPRSASLLAAIDRRVKGAGQPAPVAAKIQHVRLFDFHHRKSFRIMSVGLLVLGIALGAFFFVNGRGQRGEPTTKPTIALVQFTTASADPQLRDLAEQTSDALSYSLSRSGMPIRMLNSVPADRAAAGDYIISGEMSRSADRIAATVRLAETAQGVTVSSNHFEASSEQIRDFPERIGAQIAAWLSNGATLLSLDRRHPLDPALLTEILAESDLPLENFQRKKRVAAKAPNVPATQVAVAFHTGFVLADLPREDRARAVSEGRVAYDRALKLAPDFGDTYWAWCLLHSETRRVECEDHLRAGDRIDPQAPYLKGYLGDLLYNVGRFEEGLEVMRLSYTHDPYDFWKISGMLQAFEANGDSEEAKELYQAGTRWWPEAAFSLFRSRILGLVDRADFASMSQVEREVGPSVLPRDYTASASIISAIKSKSIPELRRVCASSDAFILAVRCMIAYSAMGDMDDAFRLADEIYPTRIGRTPAETEHIWLNDPAMARLEFVNSPAAVLMRRDARYIAVMQRVGMLDYWRAGRPPDFCRKNPEPVCRQLLKRH